MSLIYFNALATLTACTTTIVRGLADATSEMSLFCNLGSLRSGRSKPSDSHSGVNPTTTMAASHSPASAAACLIALSSSIASAPPRRWMRVHKRLNLTVGGLTNPRMSAGWDRSFSFCPAAGGSVFRYSTSTKAGESPFRKTVAFSSIVPCLWVHALGTSKNGHRF